MNLFALLRRSRSFVVLSLMTLGLLMAAPEAHAGHWIVTSYTCNGTNTTTTPVFSNPWGTTQNANPVTERAGYGQYASAVSGSLTATLTWTQDGGSPYSPPAQVYLLQTLNCSAMGSTAGSTVTDGWGDTFPGSGTANCSGQFVHSVQVLNPNFLTTLSVPAVTATVFAYNANPGGGNCVASITLTTAVVNFVVNVNPTGQNPMQVVASKPVIVKVPGWTATGTGGYVQINTACPNQGGALCFYAGPYPGQTPIQHGGMNFQATCTTPQTPVFGTGTLELVQIVIPQESYMTDVTQTLLSVLCFLVFMVSGKLVVWTSHCSICTPIT